MKNEISGGVMVSGSKLLIQKPDDIIRPSFIDWWVHIRYEGRWTEMIRPIRREESSKVDQAQLDQHCHFSKRSTVDMGCSQSSDVANGAQYKPLRSPHATRPETSDTPVRSAYIIRKRSIRIDPTRDLGHEPPASQGIGRAQNEFPLQLTDDEAREILREVLDGSEPMEIDGVFSPLGSPDSLLLCTTSSRTLPQSAAEESQKLASWEPEKEDGVFWSLVDPVNRPRTVSDDVKMIISQDSDYHPLDSVEWSQFPNLPAYEVSSAEKQNSFCQSVR